MRRKFYATVALLCIAFAAHAQSPIAPPKEPSKFKASAPTTVKAGEHIRVDASNAKGDVDFAFDELAFPKSRATIIGKTLILSTSVSGTYSVTVYSWDDKAKERVDVKVTGGVDPKLDDPPADPLMDAINKVAAELTKYQSYNNAQFDAIWSILKAKPPTPKATVTHLTFVWATSADLTPVNDAEFRDWLKISGVKVHVYAANDSEISKRGLASAVAKAGGAPAVILQDIDGNIITQSRSTTSAAAKELVLKHWGK